METITRRVREMYDLFPYPSPESGTKRFKELSNLLTIFTRETGYDFRGKTILDAGTGSGHRLLEAARTLKDARFLAIDVSERSLAIARETAQREGIENVDFRSFDLMDSSADLGRFDVILCMGVLHHLADPQRGMKNLVRNLSDQGLLFFYVYGAHGSHERMRRKKLISLLLGKSAGDFDRAIQMIRDLGCDSMSYGWNLNVDDERTKQSLYVDSYLNVHECLFDADSIWNLVRDSGLDGFMTFGITVEQRGYLFETRLDTAHDAMFQRTEIGKKLSTPLLIEAYERLTLRERYRLVDLLYQPNGYTVVGLTPGAERLFKCDSRILENALKVSD